MSPTRDSESNTKSGFGGLRICSFESRKSEEMRSLIQRQSGLATIAPSMQEVPLGGHPAVFNFAEQLFAGAIDIVVFMTGVGAETVLAAVETQYPRERFLDALRATCCVLRGPKPAAVFRKWKAPFRCQAPEPNTWRELIGVMDAELTLDAQVIAVQEYGVPNMEFYKELENRGATVLPVPVYRWELPEDTAPLQGAIRATIDGNFDVLLFTSAQQLHNVLEVAAAGGLRDDWLSAAKNCVVASIGPTASEHLRAAGLPVDLEPTHPKMGHLVREAATAAPGILQKKRTGM